MDVPETTCGIITYLCGCDGKVVADSCSDHDGYAGAPTASDKQIESNDVRIGASCSVDVDAAVDE